MPSGLVRKYSAQTLGLGGVLALAGLSLALTQEAHLRLGLVIFAGVLICVVLFFGIRRALAAFLRRVIDDHLGDLILAEDAASILTDDQGRVIARNHAATDLSGPDVAQVSDILGRYFANPVATALRFQHHAMSGRQVTETVTTRSGSYAVSVARAGAQRFMWQFTPIRTPQSEVATVFPMLTAGPTGTILFMNDEFRSLVGGRAKNLQAIFGPAEPQSGRIVTVTTVNGPMACMTVVIHASGGRREVVLLPGAAVPTPALASWDAIEDLPVPLLKVARTGELLSANREARILLGDPQGESLRLSDLLEGLGRPIIDWLDDVAGERTKNTREFLRGTGEKQDFFVQVALHKTADGRHDELIAVLNDMTEFKSLEAQFVQSQKMQAIGQLAGGVAHDFNNLLTAISGHCDLLLLRHDSSDVDYADLVQINQNANRAASLVGQLLAFSRKQNLSLEVLDLRDTLSDLTHLLNRLVGERIALSLSYDPALFPIRADKRQLEQVIMNLVVNARDAMPGGGSIRVESENITLKQDVRRDRATVQAGRYVLIRVVDEGHGIPPEKINKIFEPFYTTKRVGEGTGLGLSTAYGIVKQTGGFIFVDSEVGRGSVFSLYFPCYDQKLEVVADNTATIPARPRQSPREGVVLLVEDEAPVRTFAARALRLKGLTVLEADSGETALAMLADPDLEVNLFVTDVIMPGRDGPTWVREALSTRPETPVIFMSGYAEDAFGENRALVPNSVFLPKPFSLADLTATVLETMASASAA